MLLELLWVIVEEIAQGIDDLRNYRSELVILLRQLLRERDEEIKGTSLRSQGFEIGYGLW